MLQEAEATALAAGRAVMRLEVRTDNPSAIALYHQAGYRQFGTVKACYEDGVLKDELYHFVLKEFIRRIEGRGHLAMDSPAIFTNRSGRFRTNSTPSGQASPPFAPHRRW